MKELTFIQSQLKAPKNQFNKFGGYKYRSCEDILKAVKSLLQEMKCTLTISDEMVQVSDRIYVKSTATIRNEAGETETATAYAREPLSKKGMDESQVTGAASSYARKYALNGLLAIDDTKDADAYNNTGQASAQRQTATDDGEDLGEILQAYALPAIEQAATKEELARIYNDYQMLHTVQAFMSALTARKKTILGK